MYNEIQSVLSHKKIFKDFTIDIQGKKTEPRPLSAMFLTNQDKYVYFVRWSPNNHFCKIILKSDHWLIYYDFFKFFQLAAMATRGLHGFQFFQLFLERTTQGSLLSIYNEIQAVLLDKNPSSTFRQEYF